jgi:acyl-CoA synthetase (AMP-forming)/AMP-acid ligase II
VFEERAHDKKLANSVALVFDNRQWTYKQLYDTALKYGTWLKDIYGVKPKEIVAIDFENSEKFIFVWFGLWSIGARVAFINYNLTGKSLVHCIRVSAASLLLVDPSVSSNITNEIREELRNVRMVTLTPDLEFAAMTTTAIRESDSARAGDKLRSMSLLIYTSGTTGLPKPAIISWSKCISGMNIIARWIGVARSDIFYTVGILPPRALIY